MATANDSLQTLMVCATVFFIKYAITIVIQGKKAFAAGSRAPEDARMAGSGAPKQNYCLMVDEADMEHSDALVQARLVDTRWRRIVQNDVETLPLGVIMFVASILVGGKNTLNIICMGIFTLMRVIYTIAYAYEMQPLRTFTWAIAHICVFIGVLNGLFTGVF